MTTLVFGHKSPDTDSTGSPIVWAWYLNEVKGIDAKPVLLGEPNTEAAFVIEKWGFAKPEIITSVEAGQKVVIVDTNNPAELPDAINDADITAIIAAKDETVVHIEAAMAAESNVDKGLEAAQAAITGGTTLALTRDFLAGLGDLLGQRKDDLDDAFGQASECQ